MIPIKRSEIINEITTSKIYDLLIIGGGIHGAVTARLASQYGIKTVLLEKNDYAFGTSSRSSKMAHGGLRYLELFDFEQVMEGVKAREKLFQDYPGQVVPYPFYIPVYAKDYFFKFKLGFGLKLYDLFNHQRERRHSWIKPREMLKHLPELQDQKLMGCFQYYDGIMSDYRLVIDNISAARKKSECLNYARVSAVKQEKDFSLVDFEDMLTNTQFQLKAKLIINTTGNDVDYFGANKNVTLKFSRGTHLLFNSPWKGPALFLPLAGKARYYFVWPHFAGTLVGTTEREIDHLVDDPKPSQSEVDEILQRLKKDLPKSNLDESTLHFSFAGIRALPVKRETRKNTAQISRKHHWIASDRIFSLYGGKFTTCEWTAKEGLALALKRLNLFSKSKFKNLDRFEDSCQDSLEVRKKYSNNQRLQFNLPRNAEIFRDPKMHQLLGGECLLGEIINAFDNEQAVTIEDFLYRRTGIGYLANSDNIVNDLKLVLSKYTKTH